MVDPEAAVGDLQANVPVAAGGRNPNPGAGRRVAQRVVEQDPQHLGDALRIALELDLLRTQVERDVGLVARGGRRELGRDLARELADVGRLRPQLQRARLQPREVEQLDGEPVHPVHLAADLLQERAPRLLVEILVGEQLEEAAEREDRRPQLVRRATR